MTALEIVTAVIGGKVIAAWDEVEVSISTEEAARSASMTLSDMGGSVVIRQGDDAVLMASGTVLITGYVRDVDVSISEDRHEVRVAIVSRTIDAVEASVDHESGFVEDKDLKQIAEAFDTCGVGIVCEESFPKEARSMVHPGQSLFYHIEPIARAHEALIYDTPEGKLRLAKKPRGRHAGRLATGPGGNIVRARAGFSEHDRHDEIAVRGQSSRGKGGGALRIEARAKDGGVKRKRPLVVIMEGEATAEKAKKRAEREVKRRAGESTRATIEVAGWRDAGGRIWEPHYLVEVAAARLYLNQDMAIRSVKLSQSQADGGEGTRAHLELVDPRALNGEGGGGSSDAAWKAPAPRGRLGGD